MLAVCLGRALGTAVTEVMGTCLGVRMRMRVEACRMMVSQWQPVPVLACSAHSACCCCMRRLRIFWWGGDASGLLPPHACLPAAWVPGKVVHVAGGARQLQALMDAQASPTMLVVDW